MIQMRKILAILCAVLIALPIGTGLAEIERHVLLDETFMMLEKGNLFVRRYNDITGAEIDPWFELGVPYFFGGGSAGPSFLVNYPEYRQMNSWQNGGGFKKENLYLLGLDCRGYMNYVFGKLGYELLVPLQDVFLDPVHRQHFIYSHREGMNVPNDWEEVARNLQIGDLLVAAGESRHVMMFIGTLADYGFTAEEEPALANYLHYPLVIHSSPNPQVNERFINLIETTPLYENCSPPSGGVAVSIIGVPLEAGEYLGNVGKAHYYGFRLDEGDKLEMTIWDFSKAVYYAWYRKPQ